MAISFLKFYLSGEISPNLLTLTSTKEILCPWCWSSGQRARLLSVNLSSNPAEIDKFSVR